MFASLRVRNYRIFASGQLLSVVGTWMQRVAQDWLVLELSDGSPVALGFAVALQFAPTLVLSLWAGVLADRYDKRTMLIGLQTGMGVTALVLGLLEVGGLVELWHVYVLCVVLGCFTAVDVPIRQAFASELVGPAAVPNAVALNSMCFNVARIVGPAIAGVLIEVIGTGWVFVVNSASFLPVVTGLLLIDAARLHRAEPVPRRRGQLVEGLRYVRNRRDLVVLLTLLFFVSTFGMTFNSTLAVVARNVFDGGADSYGLLSTMLAIGTLAGATLAARRSGAAGRPRLRIVFGGAIAFGVLEFGLGFMPTYGLFAVALIPAGAALLTFTTAMNSTVQLSVDAQFRGRVMGLYMLLFLGGMPIGAPFAGWLADVAGGRAPIIVGGAMTTVAGVVCAVLMARMSDPARSGSPDRANYPTDIDELQRLG